MLSSGFLEINAVRAAEGSYFKRESAEKGRVTRGREMRVVLEGVQKHGGMRTSLTLDATMAKVPDD